MFFFFLFCFPRMIQNACTSFLSFFRFLFLCSFLSSNGTMTTCCSCRSVHACPKTNLVPIIFPFACMLKAQLKEKQALSLFHLLHHARARHALRPSPLFKGQLLANFSFFRNQTRQTQLRLPQREITLLTFLASKWGPICFCVTLSSSKPFCFLGWRVWKASPSPSPFFIEIMQQFEGKVSLRHTASKTDCISLFAKTTAGK